jgi:2-polyprenyl-3-methyl-5-hydroxy-6-metoxy-1,4-benzoquinol methylase
MHGAKPASMEEWLKDTEGDDQRRFEMVKTMLPNTRLLDFGCGAAGFLRRAQTLAAEVCGIELEARVQEHWQGKINIFSSVDALVGRGFDLITAFHVVEHVSDPRTVLSSLAKLLQPGSRMIIEVPSSEDALLSLYDCNAFQSFTYWSQHLFLFNSTTLEMLARQAGLKVVATHRYQRYPLSNHLYWLCKAQPGGHKHWGFLDTPELSRAYASALAAVGQTDTLIAYLEMG